MPVDVAEAINNAKNNIPKVLKKKALKIIHEIDSSKTAEELTRSLPIKDGLKQCILRNAAPDDPACQFAAEEIAMTLHIPMLQYLTLIFSIIFMTYNVVHIIFFGDGV